MLLKESLVKTVKSNETVGLRTQKEITMEFYRRFGFELVTTVKLNKYIPFYGENDLAYVMKKNKS